jgi:Holliday junction resolvasome RuvABC DNA-binding subunit
MDDLASAEMGHRKSEGGALEGSSQDAIRALVSLGYATADAERAVKAAIDGAGTTLTAPELIREALAKVTDARR